MNILKQFIRNLFGDQETDELETAFWDNYEENTRQMLRN